MDVLLMIYAALGLLTAYKLLTRYDWILAVPVLPFCIVWPALWVLQWWIKEEEL